MRPDDPRHGTDAGYQAHRRAKEAACEQCRNGRREYQAKFRGGRDESARATERKRDAARSRALWHLANTHPDEFKRAYLDELKKLLAEVAA